MSGNECMCRTLLITSHIIRGQTGGESRGTSLLSARATCTPQQT